MLVMRSHDAEADRRQFKADGIGDFARFDFARKARRPDGSEVDVAFSLAFAASPALPEAGFFVCQQRFPENFWSRAAQVHPNGARGIAGLAIAHENPREAADFLSRFVGAGAARREGQGFVVEADGARIECCPRAALAERYGASAIGADGPPLALARIAVADIAATRAILEAGGVGYRERDGALVVGAGEAMGAALAFEAERSRVRLPYGTPCLAPSIDRSFGAHSEARTTMDIAGRFSDDVGRSGGRAARTHRAAPRAFAVSGRTVAPPGLRQPRVLGLGQLPRERPRLRRDLPPQRPA